jgi:hypothetical protein
VGAFFMSNMADWITEVEFLEILDIIKTINITDVGRISFLFDKSQDQYSFKSVTIVISVLTYFLIDPEDYYEDGNVIDFYHSIENYKAKDLQKILKTVLANGWEYIHHRNEYRLNIHMYKDVDDYILDGRISFSIDYDWRECCTNLYQGLTILHLSNTMMIKKYIFSKKSFSNFNIKKVINVCKIIWYGSRLDNFY